MHRTNNLQIDLNSFTFEFGCLDSFSNSTLDVWYQIISIVVDTSKDVKISYPVCQVAFSTLNEFGPWLFSTVFDTAKSSVLVTSLFAFFHIQCMDQDYFTPCLTFTQDIPSDVTCLQLLSIYTVNFSTKQNKNFFWEIWCRYDWLKSGRDKKEK